MEFYARYAHKFLWHESLWTMPLKDRKEWNRPIWLLHESHHLPREGAFEANDVFALANGDEAAGLLRRTQPAEDFDRLRRGHGATKTTPPPPPPPSCPALRLLLFGGCGL